MANKSGSLPPTLWIGFMLALGLGLLAGFLAFAKHAKAQELPVLGQVDDFTLTSQNGAVTTLADFTNHVWVADIIFTRCAGPCPHMTMQMKSVQDALAADANARLVTLTTDPDNDTPEVLSRYAKHYGADTNRWTFLTGTKPGIAGLAAGGLKLSSMPVKPAEQKDAADLFIHTTIFVVVDKHAQLRGAFETGGDGVDWTNDVEPRLLESVNQLEREP
jgi:protein SCO1/2